MTREEELTESGWQKRFVACEPRLSEMAEIYRQIGLEVLLEPLAENKEQLDTSKHSCEDCTICFDQDKEKYRTIYTRAVRPGADDQSGSD